MSADEPVFEAHGVTGSLSAWRDRVVIRRKGWPYGTKSEKTVHMRSIGAVQWREPGGLMNGFIQIAHSGSQESKGGTFDAVKDENSIVFVKKAAPDFARIRDFIQERISLAHAPQPAQAASAPTSLADELTKLAALRDQGVLTPEEFDAQKARLLG